MCFTSTRKTLVIRRYASLWYSSKLLVKCYRKVTYNTLIDKKKWRIFSKSLKLEPDIYFSARYTSTVIHSYGYPILTSVSMTQFEIPGATPRGEPTFSSSAPGRRTRTCNRFLLLSQGRCSRLLSLVVPAFLMTLLI